MGLDPQSPQIGVVVGIPGQAQDDMFACFETHQINGIYQRKCPSCLNYPIIKQLKINYYYYT